LAKKFDDLVTEIPVRIAPTRDEAERVIANIHTKNYRRTWKPLREAYFYKKKINEGYSIDELRDNYSGVDIKRWISMLDMHHIAKSLDLDEKIKKIVHNDRTFPITNLERMYDASEVREFLGIEFDSESKVRGKTKEEEFKKGFNKIVEDVAKGDIDSRSMSNSKARKKYLRNLDENFTPDTSKEGNFTAESFEEFNLEFDKEGHKKEYEKEKRSRRKPSGLIPSGITYNLNNSSLQELFKELKRIKVKECPNATAILFCSFLERSLHQYFLEKEVIDPSEDYYLEKLMNLVKNRPKSGITDDKAIEAARRNENKVENLYTTYSLNAIKHNKDFTVTEDYVRSLWNNYEGLMKIILNP
jgi:hypothetical protein